MWWFEATRRVLEPDLAIPSSPPWRSRERGAFHLMVGEKNQKLTPRANRPTESVAALAAQDVEEELTRIWRELLRVHEVEPTQNFFDLGGDSSLGVEMFSKIEEIFRVKLPLASLYDASTIQELARVITDEGRASRWSPLVAIQPDGSRPPLFCVHGAGGTVLIYRELSRYLGNDQPFYGLQSVGMDGSHAPLASVEEMAGAYIRDVRKVQSRGPYFLCGYCSGGTIAYEMAQQLQSAGETVALLVMLDTMNWHKIPLNLWSRTSHAVQQSYFHTASCLSLDSSGRTKFLRGKFDVLRSRIPVWQGSLLAKLGMPSSTTSDRILLSQIWTANDRASWNYRPKPYNGTVTDIRPSKQYRVFSKPGLKWELLARGGQNTITLPVYPGMMLIEPFVEQLAAILRNRIDSAVRSREDKVSNETAVTT
jgi:phthiocerol/phenolphthiocerol synthesis type-I polyketide synthase E